MTKAVLTPICADALYGGEGFRAHAPRHIAERQIRHKIMLRVEQMIQIEEVPDGGTHGAQCLRGTLYVADGWRGAEAAADRIVAEANHMLAHAIQTMLSWEGEAKSREAALAKAEAEFSQRFRTAVSEFMGYDECVGRR